MAACSGVHAFVGAVAGAVGLACGVTAVLPCAGAGGIVQCPIEACSGVHVVAAFGAGCGDVGSVQWPIAACSGRQVLAGAGFAAGAA